MSLFEGCGLRVNILSHHSPSSLKQPLIRDSNSKALLSAMSKLAEKTGNKVFVSNNKSWLDHFSAAGQGGVGVDWALVQTHTAPLSKQAIKNAIKRWGSNKWQLRWAKLAACQQKKVWFPAIKNVPTHFVRMLNRYDLSHVIHFTTGHNLLRYRCKLAGGGSDVCRLCGESKEDALHLWTECSATRDLGRGACYGSYQMVNMSAQQVPQGANNC